MNPLAAMVWSAVAIAAAPAAGWIQPRLSERALAWIGRARPLLPWVYGLVPSYGALWTGAVPAGYMGVYGGDGLAGWVGPAVVLGILLLAISAWLGQRPLPRPAETRFDRVVLDEPRWALYRATGAVALVSVPWGMLIGLGLGVVEWALARQVWKESNRRQPATCLELARLATSAIAFAISGNLWLTIVFQVAWLSMLDSE